jgi:hypothetical protein
MKILLYALTLSISFQIFADDIKYEPSELIKGIQAQYLSPNLTDKRLFKNFSALIIPEDNPSCLYDLKKSKLICSSGTIALENKLFGMWYGDVGTFSFSKVPQDVVDKIDYPSLALSEAGMKEFCLDKKTSTINCAIMIIAHEGFHMVEQLPGSISNLTRFGVEVPPVFTSLASKSAWTEWNIGEPNERQDVVGSCFSHDSSISLELETLMTSLKLILADQRDESIKYAKEFLKLRSERYNELKGTSIKLLNSAASVGCEEAEKLMEMLEGTADYVGLSTELDSHSNNSLINMIESERFHSAGENEWYYRFGSAQIFLLKNLFPKKYSKPIDTIFKNKSKLGLSELLELELENF